MHLVMAANTEAFKVTVLVCQLRIFVYMLNVVYDLRRFHLAVPPAHHAHIIIAALNMLCFAPPFL